MVLSKKLKEKILYMIKEDEKCFILTGSEPGGGCCPSEMVGEANMLVKEGLLDSSPSPGTNDSCPVTVYTFPGEIQKSLPGLLQFTINPVERKRFLENLMDKKNIKKNRIRKILQITLLLFIGLTLLLTFIKPDNKKTENQPVNQGVLIYYFHPHLRCGPCLKMEQLTKEAAGKIPLIMVDMDMPEATEMVKTFNVMTSTPVIAFLEKGIVIKYKNLTEKAWQSYTKPEIYKKMIINEISLLQEKNVE